jgi:hypothetical protein
VGGGGLKSKGPRWFESGVRGNLGQCQNSAVPDALTPFPRIPPRSRTVILVADRDGFGAIVMRGGNTQKQKPEPRMAGASHLLGPVSGTRSISNVNISCNVAGHNGGDSNADSKNTEGRFPRHLRPHRLGISMSSGLNLLRRSVIGRQHSVQKEHDEGASFSKPRWASQSKCPPRRALKCFANPSKSTPGLYSCPRQAIKSNASGAQKPELDQGSMWRATLNMPTNSSSADGSGMVPRSRARVPPMRSDNDGCAVGLASSGPALCHAVTRAYAE